VHSTDAPLELPGGDAEPSEADQAIARHAVGFISSGATLQVGIGSIPNQIATLLAEGDGGDYGLHSEMFTDGCMKMHRAGKIANDRKGQYDGVSVTTFAFGSNELYEWLDGNTDVAFLPVEIVNSPEVIAANNDMISINGALAIDVQGQVVADTINGDQFSGIGGAEDFVAGAGLEVSDRSLICLPATFSKDDELKSRIVPAFGAGAVVTTPRHHVDVIVTEYGVAELEGKTVRERGEALAAIAHPQFRDELLAAARG
jgi:acyl-CoA hydrolase